MSDHPFGDELYEGVAPLAYADADNGYALRTLCYAIGELFAQVELLARADAAGNDPWSVIMDVDRALGYMLPYLGQFVGQAIPVGTPDAVARDLIRSPSNQERGTLAKIVTDAKRTLTGTQYIRVIERDGSPWRLSVFTRTSETPDPAATDAAIQAVKPAGIVVNHVTSAGVVIDELTGTIDALSGSIDSHF
jgi:hypothetical protein